MKLLPADATPRDGCTERRLESVVQKIFASETVSTRHSTVAGPPHQRTP
jgi:hypothetical protein